MLLKINNYFLTFLITAQPLFGQDKQTANSSQISDIVKFLIDADIKVISAFAAILFFIAVLSFPIGGVIREILKLIGKKVLANAIKNLTEKDKDLFLKLLDNYGEEAKLRRETKILVFTSDPDNSFFRKLKYKYNFDNLMFEELPGLGSESVEKTEWNKWTPDEWQKYDLLVIDHMSGLQLTESGHPEGGLQEYLQTKKLQQTVNKPIFYFGKGRIKLAGVFNAANSEAQVYGNLMSSVRYCKTLS